RCDAASLAEIDLGTSAVNPDVANATRSVVAHEPQRDLMRAVIKTSSWRLAYPEPRRVGATSAAHLANESRFVASVPVHAPGATWGLMVRLALTMIAMFALSSDAGAWGCLGHIIIAQIAADQLTDQARGAVDDLLAGHSLAEVSCWADEVRPARP